MFLESKERKVRINRQQKKQQIVGKNERKVRIRTDFVINRREDRISTKKKKKKK